MIAQEYAEIEAKFAMEAQKAGVLDEWIKMFYAPRMAFRIMLGMGELYPFTFLALANSPRPPNDPAAHWRQLLLLLWDRDIQIHGYQQQLCDPVDSQRHQLWHDFLWPVYHRALWSQEVSHGR
jgi:hypothetical protein